MFPALVIDIELKPVLQLFLHQIKIAESPHQGDLKNILIPVHIRDTGLIHEVGHLIQLLGKDRADDLIVHVQKQTIGNLHIFSPIFKDGEPLPMQFRRIIQSIFLKNILNFFRPVLQFLFQPIHCLIEFSV